MPEQKPSASRVDPQDSLAALTRRIDSCLLRDRKGLRRRARTIARRQRQGRPADRLLRALAADVRSSEEHLSRRRSSCPQPSFPPELPISARRAQIAEVLAANQVVIVCGETGSGKTTQLPKVCLALGRGTAGMIGHTQPRRIAARSVAARIANELGSELGHAVGYKVRFRDHVSPESYVKVMTDGILLAEIRSDEFLEQYDTIIIDEAHERTLNIDFLLGYLKQLLPRRPDFKLIITSATIDPERFSQHFDSAPIIEVSGRTHPVEVRYRPVSAVDIEGSDRDPQQAILEAVDEVSREGPGDVLVFLSGEREIREAAEALRKHHPPHTEILPLYARLTAAEQNRIFQPHVGRRIVLATNVAETSLTVPGIRYVVDPGYARLSRYSYRTKVQMLPIEKISQASANQRAGRCGRVAAGICIRLYAQEDFETRPLFTDPEILRTNLASVILQMQTQGLGDVEHFPFVDRPEPRLVKDGYRLLEELRALEGGRVTPLGQRLARLSVDPRVGSMILAAAEFNCLTEVLVIAAALSIQDPRERPLEQRQKADEAHSQFDDEHSDFIAFLNLWKFYSDQRKHLSNSKLRQLCRQNFLSYVRMQEWRDIHSQLLTQAREMALACNTVAAEYEAIHQAILSGLLANVGFRADTTEYTGARSARFAIFPASGLAKKRPKWIMAAELIETARLYAHVVARIEPQWIERLAPHLVKRSYSEPHWEKRPGQAAAFETTSLYGLTITTSRKVNYGPIDPETSREIFIRSALVQGHFTTQAPFFKHNAELIAQVEALEHRSRRQDILIDEETLYQFYAQRIPDGIYSGKHFERWRQQAERDNPRLLFLTRDYLMRHAAQSVTVAQYPEFLTVDGIRLPLNYRFEPGHPADGVTVRIPVAVLNTVKPARFEWLVPGMLREKVTMLIKSLPKTWRRHFVPVPEFADACVDALTPDDTPLVDAVAHHLRKITGVDVPREAWREEDLPEHYRMYFEVLDDEGGGIAWGRDLSELQQRLRDRARASFRSAPRWDIEREGITDWDFGELPALVVADLDGLRVQGYPGLIDRETSVALAVFDTLRQAEDVTRQGLRRLFMLRLPQQMKYLDKNLPRLGEMCLSYAAVGSCQELRKDLVTAIVDRAFLGDQPLPRTRSTFERRLDAGRAELMATANGLCKLVAEVLEEFAGRQRMLAGALPPRFLAAAGDVREQLRHLVHAGFITATPDTWLRQFPRYLRAIGLRLEKLENAPERDRANAAQLAHLWQRYLEFTSEAKDKPEPNPQLDLYRWMIEELRVSLFAQELKTLVPVSIQRLEKQWAKVVRNE